jgi:hypothetical protein
MSLERGHSCPPSPSDQAEADKTVSVTDRSWRNAFFAVRELNSHVFLLDA